MSTKTVDQSIFNNRMLSIATRINFIRVTLGVYRMNLRSYQKSILAFLLGFGFSSLFMTVDFSAHLTSYKHCWYNYKANKPSTGLSEDARTSALSSMADNQFRCCSPDVPIS
uniref:Uncharacterized protein n=1 Tax=Schistocephalus solidus TaxID=70667 RepID=A0A0X3PGQ4_SCHSO